MSKRSRNLARNCAVYLLANTLLALSVASEARAAQGVEGIVVQSTGSASARPTQVEMSAKLAADAELAADAAVKFHDAKKRALAALAALKNSDLSVTPGGVTVAASLDANSQQMLAMRGISAGTTNQKVRIAETNRIVLAHADQLEPEELLASLLKILDVAKDAGFQFTLPPTNDYYEMQARAQEGQVVFLFKLPDSTILRKKAYKAAIEDAKAKAQELADLSSTKLGRILSVVEGPGGNMQRVVYYNSAMNQAGGDDNALSSVSAAEVTLRVNLTVQFEIAK
jgi:uncharacterized protein YggE